MAGTSWIQGKYSIIQGEAIALLEAMKELGQKGFTNVIFETDSKSIVDAIERVSIGISEFSSLICIIKNIMSLHLSIDIKFVKRIWLLICLLGRPFFDLVALFL
jgi:hypothetical protein